MKLRFLPIAIVALSTMVFAQPQYVGWSMGYYPAWNQSAVPPSQINWKAITHLAHFALTAYSDGSLNVNANSLNDARCRAAVAEAHKHNVKIVISIGGYLAGAGLTSATKPANIHKFVKNLLDFMRKYGYDGIDTDWEENFNDVQFLAWHKELRDSINNITPRPLLTMAGAGFFAKHCAPSWSYVDQLNDMSYDLKYNNLTNRLKQFTDLGVPKSILGVGIGIGSATPVGNGEMVDGTPTDWSGKAMWSINNGMGGIMQWQIKSSSLVTAAYQYLERYIDPNFATFVFDRGNMRVRQGATLTVVRNIQTGIPEIHYTVADDGLGAVVNLNLFDPNGNLLRQIVHGRAAPGNYSIPLDQGSGSSLRSGNYIVRLSAGSQTESAVAAVLR